MDGEVYVEVRYFERTDVQYNLKLMKHRRHHMKKANGIATTGFWLMLAAIIFGIATNGGLKTIMNF